MSTTTLTDNFTDNSPSIGREGVYFHRGSKQFVSRLGFEFNPRGERVRAFQYLTGDPEQATVKHVQIVARWKWTKSSWSDIKEVIRPGLPEVFRDTADLSLPVWIKDEWFEEAKRLGLAGRTSDLQKAVRFATAQIDGGKKVAQYLADRPQELNLLPSADRATVLQAVAPAANGFTPDVQQVTVAQAKQLYLDDCRSRIGLAEESIKAGTYQNMARMLRLGLDLRTIGSDGIEHLAIDPNAALDSLTRDKLVAFKRGWLGKVTAGEIAKRTAANYAKSVQFLLAWCYKRDGIASRRVGDLDDVFRFTDTNPINIADYATVKADLKTLLAAATDRVKLYIYLGLNCGHYQVDIGSLKLGEIQGKGKVWCIVRKRDKTSHQNDFVSSHPLWPETWKLLEQHLAPADPVANPLGLALLNEAGQPLHQATADNARIDNITSSYWRVVDAVNTEREKKKLAAISLPFKQFRKLGATAMNRIGGETVQRLYRAAAFEGSDKFYVAKDFTLLTAAMKTWAGTLRKDGMDFPTNGGRCGGQDKMPARRSE